MNAKDIEQLNIEEFLKLADYHIEECKISERPDFICTIKQLGQSGKDVVGIEYTDYYHDTTPGSPSSGQFLYDFWGTVTKHIESKIDNDSQFHNVHCYFKLDKQKLKLKAKGIKSKQEGLSLCFSIADQISDLVSDFLTTGDAERFYCNYHRMPEGMLPIPKTYTEINEFFLQIDLQKVNCWLSIRYGWHANINAAHIGLSASKITDIVSKKKDKCESYSLDDIDELWLLIGSPATTVYNAAPPQQFVTDKLDDEKLLNACESSKFDKVFFWSRKNVPWFKQIWPQIKTSTLGSSKTA